MARREVDVAIIGAGTAGLAAYRGALEYTNNVVLIDGGPLGTTCARVGCMPSKLLIAAAEAAHAAENSRQFGVEVGEAVIHGEEVMRRVQAERDRFVGFVLDAIDHIPEEHKIAGFAEFIDDHVLKISDGSEVVAKSIVIATGSRPFAPPILLAAGDRMLDNESLFELRDLPKKVAVFGPGVIGLELGQALSRLGVEIRLFGVGGALGPLKDPSVKDYAIQHFAKEFPLDVDASVESVKRTEGGVVVRYAGADGSTVEETFEYLLAATGRRPNIDKVGLANTSLTLNERGMPEFDAYTMQCEKSHIFIAGDVNNDRPLLHEAADEGRIAGQNAAQYPTAVRSGKRRAGLAVVFSDPQMASVGLNLDQVKKRCDGCFAIGEVSFEDQGRSRVMGVNHGMLRLYGEQGSGLFLGAEMFGPRAEHIAHLLSWAVQQRMTVSTMLEMPFYHPVIEEGVRTALRDLNAKLKIGPEIVQHCMDCGPGV